MKRIGKTTSAIADRLLAAFLLAVFLSVPVAYQLAAGMESDSSLRADIDHGRNARLDTAPLDELNAPDVTGMTPLMVACMLGRDEAVDRLLARGVDVNAADPSLGTALMIAAHYGRASIIASLLRHGANPTHRTPINNDALWCAVLGGNAACVTSLLRAGARPSDPRQYALLSGVTATGDRADLVRLLVAAGADPNLPGPDGVPPLLDLAELDAPDCVRAMLQLGADPAARDRTGRTARDVAASFGHADIVRLLDQHASAPSHLPPGTERNLKISVTPASRPAMIPPR